MKLEDYLTQKFTGDAKQGAVAVESDWLDAFGIDLSSGKIHLMDPCQLGVAAEAYTASLPAGTFEVKVKVMPFGWDVRVSRLRIVRTDSPLVLGNQMGEIGIDAANIAICNFPPHEAAKDELTGEKIYAALVDQNGLAKIFKPDGPAEDVIVAISTGFGDGRYPIYELTNDAGRAGLELVFIKPGTGYIFPDQSAPEEPDEHQKLLIKLTESVWDAGWAALRLGDNSAREFFTSLSAGMRAAFALRVFANYLRSGWIRDVFKHKANPCLAEEILKGFHLLGLASYSERFSKLSEMYWEIDLLEQRQKGIWKRLKAAQGKMKTVRINNRQITPYSATQKRKAELHSHYDDLEASLIEFSKDPDTRLERIFSDYVRNHPAEFAGVVS